MPTHRVLTEGSVPRAIVALALPVVLTNVLQTAYNLTDMFWLGRLGVNAVAAVSLSFPMIFLILSLAGGFAVAGGVLVAQFAGRRDQAMVDYIAAQTLFLLVILGAGLSLAGFVVIGPLLDLFGVEPAVRVDALAYQRLIFPGFVFMLAYLAFQSILRGVGRVRLPLYIAGGTVLLNLFLDPLLIFGRGPIPALGVSGAAIATIATQALSAVIGLVIMARGSCGVRVRRRALRLDPPAARQLFNLALPVSGEQLTVSFGLLMMVYLVVPFGTRAVAAYGIGTRVFGLAVIPAFGFSMALSTLVGQNLGAGKIARAEAAARLTVVIAFLALSLLGVFLHVFAERVSTFFVPGDAPVIADSAAFIRVMALSFGFMGIKQVLNGVFTGSGNTRTALFLSLVYLWGMRIPVALVLSRFTPLGDAGVWLSFPAANLLGAVVAAWLYRRGAWKDKRLADEFRRATRGED